MTIKPECALVEEVSLTKAQKAFLEYCRKLGYGKIEVVVKNGEPVLATKKEEYLKFD